MTAAARDDDALVAGFEAATLASFHHADHVHVVWIYLGRLALLDAAQAFTANLKRFAAARGKPDLYHETITLAFVLVIADRIARRGRGDTWSAFAAANPDLLTWQPSILDRCYDRETLDSPLAKRTFLWPSITPLQRYPFTPF